MFTSKNNAQIIFFLYLVCVRVNMSGVYWSAWYLYGNACWRWCTCWASPICLRLASVAPSAWQAASASLKFILYFPAAERRWNTPAVLAERQQQQRYLHCDVWPLSSFTVQNDSISTGENRKLIWGRATILNPALIGWQMFFFSPTVIKTKLQYVSTCELVHK